MVDTAMNVTFSLVECWVRHVLPVVVWDSLRAGRLVQEDRAIFRPARTRSQYLVECDIYHFKIILGGCRQII